MKVRILNLKNLTNPTFPFFFVNLFRIEIKYDHDDHDVTKETSAVLKRASQNKSCHDLTLNSTHITESSSSSNFQQTRHRNRSVDSGLNDSPSVAENKRSSVVSEIVAM